MRLQPVILSGGSGTRLWPLSRGAYPKQFLPLVGETTLLQATAGRLEGLQAAEVKPALVVCNEAHRFLVAEQLLEAGHRAGRILLEPVGRNTAPALALAALEARRDGDDPILIAMPADHVINDTEAFKAAVQLGLTHAAQDSVVTFGIVPRLPETGFGYIRKGEPLTAEQAFDLEAFVEKPDKTTAERYLASGEYLWNSGIFMLRAGLWLKLLRRYRSDIVEAVEAAYSGGWQDMDFYRLNNEAFAGCPSDSIDYAVMEPLAAARDHAVTVVCLDAGWSDIGGWSALWSVSEQDRQGNAVFGDVFAHHAHDNLLHAESRMVAAVGVKDLIVVETADAVLVADKSHAQDVKSVPNFLKECGRRECEFHRQVHRPWGSFEGMDQGDRFQVKRLTVKPGASLSVQMHHHRAEHWIVVKGTARVTREDEVFLLTENQSTYIPIGAQHRLENPGTIPLEIIEVQSGSYLGEDDIVRFDDVYNRKSQDG